MAKRLAITMVENIRKNRMLEDFTVEAVLAEIELRVGKPKDTEIVGPSMATVYAREKVEGEDWNEHERDWARRIRAAKHVFIVVHAYEPNRFTCLEVHKGPENSTVVEYRDSLKTPHETARQTAKDILVNLEFATPEFELSQAKNKTYQTGGLECGIWSSRWIERSLASCEEKGDSAR